jgi:hypothetical protein
MPGREKVEARSDPQRYHRPHGLPVSVDPEFLLRRTEPDENQIRLRGARARHGRAGGVRPISRDSAIVVPDNTYPKFVGKTPGGGVRRAWASPEQVHSPSPPRGQLHQREEDIGSGHAFGQRTSEEPAHPYQWHAVSQRQAHVLIRNSESLVRLRLDDMIDVGSVDRTSTSCIDQLFDIAKRFVEGNRIDPKAADAKATTAMITSVRKHHARRQRNRRGGRNRAILSR